jgi:hypothetical protein
MTMIEMQAVVPPLPAMPEMLAVIEPIDPLLVEFIYPTPGRNDPCHCGSGDKYKKCHQPIDQEAWRFVMQKSREADAVLAYLRAIPSNHRTYDPEPE